jgi:hypothetical protein
LTIQYGLMDNIHLITVLAELWSAQSISTYSFHANVNPY